MFMAKILNKAHYRNAFIVPISSEFQAGKKWGRNRMGRWFDFINFSETDCAIMTLKSFSHIERNKTSLLNKDSI